MRIIFSIIFGIATITCVSSFVSAQEGSYAPPIEIPADSLHMVSDLEIAVPSNWEIRKKSENSFFALDRKIVNDYQKNVTVKTFAGKRYIDEITAELFKNMVKKKYTQALKSISNYETAETEYISLENGNEAILMYSTFSIDGVDLMHMHVIVSSDKNHYLVTYTDAHSSLAEEDSASFQLAWNTISRVSVPYTPGSNRYEKTLYSVGAAGSILLTILIILFIRKRLMGKDVDHFNEDEHDDLDDDLDREGEWVVESDKYDEGDGEPHNELDDFDETA
jgi:hypothetical protein